MDGNVSFDGVLKISTMILKNRNSQRYFLLLFIEFSVSMCFKCQYNGS